MERKNQGRMKEAGAHEARMEKQSQEHQARLREAKEEADGKVAQKEADIADQE